MRRLPAAAFAALAAATVAAFFVTQHLKVSNPLINGFPKPTPATIAPAHDGCGGSYRVAHLSFYLQHRADDVAVYIVDSSGQIVRTLAGDRHMRRGVRRPDGEFDWDGRTDSGQVVPDGSYFWRVVLLGQGRTIELPQPVTVKDRGPRPRVVSVVPRLIPAGARRRDSLHRQRAPRRLDRDLPHRPPRAVAAGEALPRLRRRPYGLGRDHRQPPGPAGYVPRRPHRHRPGVQRRALPQRASAAAGHDSWRRRYGPLSRRRAAAGTGSGRRGVVSPRRLPRAAVPLDAHPGRGPPSGSRPRRHGCAPCTGAPRRPRRLRARTPFRFPSHVDSAAGRVGPRPCASGRAGRPAGAYLGR